MLQNWLELLVQEQELLTYTQEDQEDLISPKKKLIWVTTHIIVKIINIMYMYLGTGAVHIGFKLLPVLYMESKVFFLSNCDIWSSKPLEKCDHSSI